MTLEQFAEVVKFVQQYHKFALWMEDDEVKARNKVYHNMGRFGAHGLNIKYVDSIYDSRDSQVWNVTFRVAGYGWQFSSNHFGVMRVKPKDWRWNTLYDMCMAFLKGEMTDKQATQFEWKSKE